VGGLGFYLLVEDVIHNTYTDLIRITLKLNGVLLRTFLHQLTPAYTGMGTEWVGCGHRCDRWWMMINITPLRI
jgi:hypothetical protein